MIKQLDFVIKRHVTITRYQNLTNFRASYVHAFLVLSCVACSVTKNNLFLITTVIFNLLRPIKTAIF